MAAEKEKSTVVVGEFVKPKGQLVQKLRAAVLSPKGKIVIVVVVVVIIGGLLYHWLYKPKLSDKQVSQNVNTLINKKDYKAAQQTINTQSNNAQSSSSLGLSAQIDVAQHDYADALKAYQQIIKNDGPDPTTLLSMGQMEQNLGNSSAALQYYQQAEPLLKAENTQESQITLANLQNLISSLK